MSRIMLLSFVLLLTACGSIPSTQPSPILLATMTSPTIAPEKPGAAITISAPVAGKTIKPLLGVNIGPIPAGTDSKNADLTNAYHQVGVNLIRTHDFYGPLDMSVMYPDRTRDPGNPASYDFKTSDPVWRAIVNGDFEPYFRLGDSWNNSKPPANAQERANWVQAAIEVVRHYRQGKWNGFSTSFRYVEIWNEPDNQQFWQKPRTAAEYFQLYVETARALKQAFPDLQIGGPGLTPAGALSPQGNKWTQDFLDYVKKNNAPLDFFSWHMYSNDPNDWVTATKFYRAALDERGFKTTTQHVTEWNTDTKPERGGAQEAIALRTGGKGAAIITAAWIGMQQQGVDVSTFYRGPDPAMDAPAFYGLFFANGIPKRTALTFSLWSKLAAHAKQLNITAPQGLWTLAGENDQGEIALLIANPGGSANEVALTFADSRRIADYKITMHRLNDTREQVITSSAASPVVDIGTNEVLLIVLSR